MATSPSNRPSRKPDPGVKPSVCMTCGEIVTWKEEDGRWVARTKDGKVHPCVK